MNLNTSVGRSDAEEEKKKKQRRGNWGAGVQWRNSAGSEAKPQLQRCLILTDNDGKSPLRVKLSPSMRQRLKQHCCSFFRIGERLASVHQESTAKHSEGAQATVTLGVSLSIASSFRGSKKKKKNGKENGDYDKCSLSISLYL